MKSTWDQRAIGIIFSLAVLGVPAAMWYDRKHPAPEKTYDGTIISLRVDDDSEYHITYRMDNKVISQDDLGSHMITIYQSPQYTTPRVTKRCPERNSPEWCHNVLRVYLPIDYKIQTFDD